ncbi:hypothetical protein Ddye_027229 [Dipteronia dyeriana]|uniref:NET domain-containing protein n=1 Tax=Dipteronia dyeriana TaxID=168575 RepID=A0AAD9WPZ8_9ROSI|nr:hypothetical protein Ddye_027229 [Dipteronia dyeriana]
MEVKSEPMQVPAAVSNPNPNPPISASQLPVRTVKPKWEPMQVPLHQYMIPTSMEEKHKLGDDEFEVNIEVLDLETLWELDRFVTNYNKIS